MSYIGNKPTVGNFQICDAISVVNGQAAYTMQVGSVNVIPQSANHMIVSLNGTIQKPNSSFTVSGAVITFSSNLVTNDVIDFIQILGDVLDLGVPSDGTVTTAKVVDGAITSAKLASGAGFNPDAAVVFNESGADVDFRVESDEKTHAIFLQGSDGKVGIDTSAPSAKFNVSNGGASGIELEPEIATNTNRITNYNRSGSAYNIFRLDALHHEILVSGTERMRIDSSGNLLVGTTDTSLYNNTSGSGHYFNPNGNNQIAAASVAPADWNRMGNDGTILGIYQAGSNEGSISVSGTTVSYNGFTGTHWSRLTDNSTPTILRGTVLETLDEMCYWYNLEFDNKKIPHVLLDGQSDGDVITYNHEGTDVQATIVKEVDVKHMMSKVSDTTDAKNVYGLFIAYDLDGEGYNDFYVASVGSYVVRIKSGQTIAKGDLLQSNGDGTAKVQTDDNIKSSSFAKVLSTTIIETYEDGSYLVPCSLMC